MIKTYKIISIVLAFSLLLSLCGCSTPQMDKYMEQKEEYKSQIGQTKILPTRYEVSEVKDVFKTLFGTFKKWQAVGEETGEDRDRETKNSVIISPFHKLSINGVSVPVYTSRCGNGAHSFAWVDVSAEKSFALDVSLSISNDVEKCVVLPQSRNINPALKGNTASCVITDEGSFTFTFSADKNAEITDFKLAPITLIVTRKSTLEIPEGYKTVEIEAGYHKNDELLFTEEKTVYIVKSGFHDVSSINVPSNSVLYIEQGAYIKATDRFNSNGSHNGDSVINIANTENSKVVSRGLIDCGSLKGGEGKYKHVVTVSQCEDAVISGLTIINSNTWTICVYNSENPLIERNLLLGYRTYSDGIMMSECKGGIGRYNFVRTGDDAIEFKGTGWNGGEMKTGSDCVYEYNDVWTDKGAGYCLTWESERPMRNMIFRNNSIGFALPVWSPRNAALDCLLGTNANTPWYDITFENIEIYHVVSPNTISIHVEGKGGRFRNITFKDIKVNSANEGVCAFRMHFSSKKGGNIEDIKLCNVNFCGKVLSESDLENKTLFCNEAKKYFDEIKFENEK